MKYTLLFIPLIFSLASTYAQVNMEKFRQDADTTGFAGNLDLDGTAITGNSDFQFISIGGRLNYNYGDDYTFLVLDAGFGWQDGESFSNNALAHLRHVVTLGEFLQLEGFAQFDYNKKRLLLSRELIGAGLRYRIYEDNYFKLRLGTAYMYEIENYDLPPNSVHKKEPRVSRLSSYLTFEIELQENLKFLSVSYYQPVVSNFDDFKLISENALVVDLGKVVDLNVKFNLRYDNKPPDTIKKTDTISKVGLSFKF